MTNTAVCYIDSFQQNKGKINICTIQQQILSGLLTGDTSRITLKKCLVVQRPTGSGAGSECLPCTERCRAGSFRDVLPRSQRSLNCPQVAQLHSRCSSSVCLFSFLLFCCITRVCRHNGFILAVQEQIRNLNNFDRVRI